MKRKHIDVGTGQRRFDVMLFSDPCGWDDEFWEELVGTLVVLVWWVIVPMHLLRDAEAHTM